MGSTEFFASKVSLTLKASVSCARLSTSEILFLSTESDKMSKRLEKFRSR